jgi:hypothetical protein
VFPRNIGRLCSAQKRISDEFFSFILGFSFGLMFSVRVVLMKGELWAGSESGELQTWPSSAVAKALAGLGDIDSFMEKSYHDLRIAPYEVGSNIPINPEVRFLVVNHASGTVWSAGNQYIAIWYVQRHKKLDFKSVTFLMILTL